MDLLAGIAAMWAFGSLVAVGAWVACSVFGGRAERAVDDWERRETGGRR